LVSVALGLLILLLAIPMLAKAINDPIGPEKLDVRPAPVPEPPLTTNEPPVLVSPSSLSISDVVVQPVPVPPISETQTAPSLTEPQTLDASANIIILAVSQSEFLTLILMFGVVLIWIWLRQTPSDFYSLRKENA